MRAVVFSNFPPQVFEQQIEPKLVEHGVEVVRMVKADVSVRVDLKQADAVIIMVDMVMQSKRKEIKDMAKLAGKRVIALERGKGASWSTVLASKEERDSSPSVMNIEPVPDAKIEEFLMQFANHVENEEDVEGMIELLKPYWTGRPLTNERQLTTYINRIKDDVRCPQQFKVWLGLHPQAFHLKRKRPEPMPPPPSARPAQSEPQIVVAREETIDDVRQMLQLYEEENAKLLVRIENLEHEREQIGEMTGRMATEKRILELDYDKLQRQVNKMTKEGFGGDQRLLTDLKAVVTSLRELVRMKVMSADEAFDRLAKFGEGR